MDFRELLSQQWARYERLSDREQLLFIITACVVGFACFVYFIWDPMTEAREAAQTRYEEEFKLYHELLALQVQRRANTSLDATMSDQSLLAVVNESTSARGISLKRVEPKNDQSLRVWIENVSFNQLLAWVALLQKNHGVSIETITLDKIPTSGYINTALVVSR